MDCNLNCKVKRIFFSETGLFEMQNIFQVNTIKQQSTAMSQNSILNFSHTIRKKHIVTEETIKMKCKLVLNRDSGNFEKLNIDALLNKLGYDAVVETIDCHSEWSAEGYDTVVVCGGDGTLSRAIAKCRGKRMIYVPCGTLNEAAAVNSKLNKLAQVNGEPFSYVCAAGSFTEIGYSTTNSAKRHWKSFAYLPQIFKNYRCHEIAAKIDADGKNLDGVYTLLMIIKSNRCFGFYFNKDYRTTQKCYLIAIRAVGHDCLVNRFKIFFPFFRIFFCGANPAIKKHWMLLPFDNLNIQLEAPQNFCVDGEKRTLKNTLHFSQVNINPPIEIIFTRTILK